MLSPTWARLSPEARTPERKPELGLQGRAPEGRFPPGQ